MPIGRRGCGGQPSVNTRWMRWLKASAAVQTTFDLSTGNLSPFLVYQSDFPPPTVTRFLSKNKNPNYLIIFIMRFATLAILSLVSGAFAGNCGPQNGNAKCAATECCKLDPINIAKWA